MLKQAVTEYKFALDRRPDKAKYVIAMQNKGTALLEQLYTEYRLTGAMENVRLADSLVVYKYEEARNWTEYLRPYMDVSPYETMYKRDYERQLTSFLDHNYGKGKSFILRRDFGRAEKYLRVIAHFDPDYRDVQSLLEFAEVEPVYSEALNIFEQRKYRATYAMLEPLHQKYPNQLEVKQLMDKAVERGQVRVGIIHGGNQASQSTSMATALSATIIRNLQKKKDPFLTLLDRSSIEVMEVEQRAIIEGRTNERAVNEELLAADIYFKLELGDFYENEGRKTSERHQGYEQYTYKEKNKEGETVTKVGYNKVYYTEYSQSTEVRYSCSVHIVDRATSEILYTDVFDFHDRQSIHYVDFSGKGPLYPGSWKFQNTAHKSDHRNTNEGERRKLDQLRKAPRKLDSLGVLRDRAQEELASKASDALENYIEKTYE
ncbi:MAG: hypothetical protein RL754_83 [Bacteroidota bacterium]